MNGQEKSDSAIVAGKPTNGAGRPAEEPVEPRAGTEGKAGHQSTRRTLCRRCVSHAMARLRPVDQRLAVVTQGRSRMREFRSYGSVRGALSNERPYRDVRREAGEEYEVKVLYGESSHCTGPEPCADDREVGGEASAGGGIGQPLSRESHIIPGADDVAASEGETDRRERKREDGPARRGLRPWHVLKLLAREPRDLLSIRGGCAAGSRRGGEEP